ncbi:hypothetical protein vseg_010190 [Gypsophila vaccaria]
MAFPQLITLLVVTLTFARIELTLCSEVKGSVSCSDCGPDYDFTGIRILVKCDQVKKLSEAMTDREGNFETTLPSETSTSPKCLARVLGGSIQLYATKQQMTSEIILAQGDKNTYTVGTPLIVSKSCHGKCGSRRTDFSSSKTIDFPVPSEFGLPPTSYFLPFIPIIGIP